MTTKLNHDKIWNRYNHRPDSGDNAKQRSEPQALGEMFNEDETSNTQTHVHASGGAKLTPEEEAAALAKMSPAAFERFNNPPRRER